MDQTNLDIYGHAPLPWSRAAEQLEAAVGPNVTHFLATVRPDGRPHVAGVGALGVDGRFYFVSGASTRKSRNLAERPNCVLSVKLPDLDLVIEGVASKVADEPTLQRLAKLYDAQGWPATVEDAAFMRPTARRAPGHRRGTCTNSPQASPSVWQQPSHSGPPAGGSTRDRQPGCCP